MLIMRVGTTLRSKAIENMLPDIEDYLDAGAEHIDTREI